MYCNRKITVCGLPNADRQRYVDKFHSLGIVKCRYRQAWFIPLADERGVCMQVKLWDPLRTRAYLSALEVCSRQGAIQIHVYLYLTRFRELAGLTIHLSYKMASKWPQEVISKLCHTYSIISHFFTYFFSFR